MPRNAEVIRQWKLLLHLDSHVHGRTVDDLAADLGVTKRTIWRDVAALQEAGFPLVDGRVDRKTTWQVLRLPLKALKESGLSVTEVCALYMSRALLLTLTGTPFEAGLESLLDKVQKALSPQTRRFLDALPSVIRVKAEPRKRPSDGYNEMVARLIEASSRRRVSEMRYFSVSSNRVKDYLVHPYLVEYVDGGLYLRAFVPEYDEVRLFAVERIRRWRATGDLFVPAAGAQDDLEPSLGMSLGTPERVVLEFTPRVAPYVREREWHRSQKIEELADGALRLHLRVCRDWALHSWVLGWGQHVRVAAPAGLAQEILSMLDGARERYVPALPFAPPVAAGIRTASSFLPSLGTARPRRRRSAAPS